MVKILVVAQHTGCRAAIARILKGAGYAVEVAEGEKRALQAAAAGGIDAAVVVPGTRLTSLARTLRNKVEKTIVLDSIMARASPGGPEEFHLPDVDEQKLLGQIRAVLDSPQGADQEDELLPAIHIENCRFDPSDHTFMGHDGREVLLTRAECTLLRALINHRGRALSRDKLRRAVAGQGAEPDDRSIDMLVGRLRRKIEPNPKVPRFVLTVSGVGYKFAARVPIAEDGQSPPTIGRERLETQASVLNLSGSAAALSSTHGLPLEPHRRQVTVLCCGLVDSATLAISLDTEDLAKVFDDFQIISSAVVTRWGGTLAKSAANEVVAVFGYPTTHEDDAERAIRASIDLTARIGVLLSPIGKPLQVRIGVATGLALVGEGQPAVGRAPITAALLRNTAPANAIIIDESTHRLLENMFICESTRADIKNNSDPVKCYRVIEERSHEKRFAATHGEKFGQLVGRQHELQQLTNLWKFSKESKGQVALLCGEAGIGKSRLCQAFLDHITHEPHIAIHYQCSPHYNNSAFYPVVRQLEHAACFRRDDTPHQKIKKLQAALSQLHATTVNSIALYAALLSIPANGHYSLQELSPQRQKNLTFAVLIEQILSMALTRPVVIVLADAHWIDSSTLELFGRCIDAIKASRVFILASFRPGFFPRWLEYSHVTMLRLNRLPREQTEAIISDVAGQKALPAEICDQIVDRSDGVPLFAEELTRAFLESGMLLEAAGQDVTAKPLRSLAIPMALFGSLCARLDRLGPAREIAQIGAAIGREFSYHLLAAVASIPHQALEAALSQLVALELIFVRGDGPDLTYTFKHALVRDAAYDTMVRSKRRQLHSRIADALMDQFSETVEAQPELIAHHLIEAGVSDRAVDYLRKAGQRAIERSANTEAIAHLTRALDLLELSPEPSARSQIALNLEVMLAQAMIAGIGYADPKTREILLRAKTHIDDSTEPSQKFAVLYGIWACHYVGGEGARQKAAAMEFVAEAERNNDLAAMCIAHRALGTTYLTMGEFATALTHLQRARALYHPEHHSTYRYQYGQDIGVAALCYLSWALWHLGYLGQASEVAAEAMQRAKELSHAHTSVYAICHARGFMDIFRRSPEDTRGYTGSAISFCTENGLWHWLNCARMLKGWADISQGELDTGLKVLRAMDAWQERGAKLWLPFFLMLEAEACAKAKGVDAALQAIEKALAVCEETNERWAMAELLRVKARLLAASKPTEAKEKEAILAHSLQIARSQQARCWELRTSCDLARLWQSRGRAKNGLDLLHSVYDQFTEGFDTVDLREVKDLIDCLERQVGRNRPRRRVMLARRGAREQ